MIYLSIILQPTCTVLAHIQRLSMHLLSIPNYKRHPKFYLRLNLFKWVFRGIILPKYHLPPLLGTSMLHPHLLRLLEQKLPCKPRVPKFRRNTEILAAAHQGVGLAALGSRRDSVRVEVLLFAASYRDQSVNSECQSVRHSQ